MIKPYSASLIANLPNGKSLILVFENEDFFLVRWWDFVSDQTDFEHWRDQIMPIETDVSQEEIKGFYT